MLDEKPTALSRSQVWLFLLVRTDTTTVEDQLMILDSDNIALWECALSRDVSVQRN